MKWFQHQSNAHRDLNVEPLIDKYGLEGSGLYWLCAEVVAERGINYQLTKDKEWKRYLISRSRFPEAKLEEMLLEMAKLNLVNDEALKNGSLFMPKMANYSDDYTKKRVRTVSVDGKDSVGIVSGQCTDSVPTKSDNVRPNKIDKIDKNIYIVLFNYWNDLGVIRHKVLTEKMRTKINSVLKDYTKADIRAGMTNYAKVVHGPEYFFKYKWTLDEFLSRGLVRFLEAPLDNWLTEKGKDTTNSLSVNNPKWKNL